MKNTLRLCYKILTVASPPSVAARCPPLTAKRRPHLRSQHRPKLSGRRRPHPHNLHRAHSHGHSSWLTTMPSRSANSRTPCSRPLPPLAQPITALRPPCPSRAQRNLAPHMPNATLTCLANAVLTFVATTPRLMLPSTSPLSTLAHVPIF